MEPTCNSYVNLSSKESIHHDCKKDVTIVLFSFRVDILEFKTKQKISDYTLFILLAFILGTMRGTRFYNEIKTAFEWKLSRDIRYEINDADYDVYHVQ